MSQCGQCHCPEYAHEKIVDSAGNYLGDFSVSGFRGFTPASWFGWLAVPGGCLGVSCSCICTYYQPMLVQPPASDGCPGNSILSFPGDANTRGPCIEDSCPLSSFAMQNSSLAIKAPIFDGSGPTGLESSPAMQIWYSGAGTEGVVFVGADEVNGDDSHSSTGWTLDPDTTWYCDFWAKSVPDLFGEVVTGADGYRLGASAGLADGDPHGGYLGFDFTDPDHGGSGLYLTDEWRFFHGQMHWGSSSPTITNAELSFARVTATSSTTETVPCGTCCSFARGRDIPRGSVRIKCLHVYPLGDGIVGDFAIHAKWRPYSADPAGNN